MFFYSEQIIKPLILLTNSSSLSFVNTYINATSSNTFTVTATGNTTEIVNLFDNTNQYSFTPSSFSLSSTGSQVITVTFAPTSWGVKTGTITLSASGGSVKNVGLSAVCIANPLIITSSVANISFGNGYLNETTSSTFIVTAGGTVQDIVLMSDDSDQFDFSPSSFSMTGANQAQNVTVYFNPTSVGSKLGVLTLSASGGDVAHISLTGSGIYRPLILTSSVDNINFSDTFVGNSSSQTFTVSAGGIGGTETIILSDNSSQFDFSPSSFSLTGGGSSQTVTTIFSPTINGVKTATLTLTATSGSTKMISLQGNAVDQYQTSTSTLLKTDSTNNKNNNTFLDGGPLNLSITRNGTPTQGSFTPFSRQSGAWSTYHPVRSSYYSNSFIVNGTTNTGNIGTNFTCEFWFKGDSNSAYSAVVAKTAWDSNSSAVWFSGIEYTGANLGKFYLTVYHSTNQTKGFYSTSRVDDDKWHHCAAVKQGTTYKIFVDGVLESTEVFATTLNSSIAYNVTIGGGTNNPTTGGDYGRTNCNISNVRITNTAVYTSAFTPSTTPLTAISGTVLLVCQDNRLKDNGPNNYSCTVQQGTPATYPVSPFIDTNPVSIGDLGSVYFDGSSYLTLADNNAWTFTGDFTIEAWVNLDSVTNEVIASHWPGGSATNSSFVFSVYNGKLYHAYGIGASNIGVTGTTTIPINTWTHLAISRTGTTLKLFVNGIVDATATVSGAYNNSTYNLTIGYANPTDQGYLNGIVSNLRIVNGTAVYTGSFSVPTSPVASIANTKLLTNFANAGVFDSTKNMIVTTTGNAKISTTQSKYGSSSISFDGTNSVVNIGNILDPRLNLGTSDFTIEGWVYPSGSITKNSAIYANYGTSYRNGMYLLRLLSANSKVAFYMYPNADVLTSTTALQANNWYHIAVSRVSGTTRLFVNGVLEASTNTALNLTSDPTKTATLGGYWQVGGTYESNGWLNGYIDDFRVTKGVGRYTSNFTPPTEL